MITADLWKLGQLRPGDRIRFQLVSHDESIKLLSKQEEFLTFKTDLGKTVSISNRRPEDLLSVLESGFNGGDKWVLRQSGDQNLLVEFGEPILDLQIRFKVHLFYKLLVENKIQGIIDLTPGIRSLQVHFEPRISVRQNVIDWIISNIDLLGEKNETSVESRIVWLPLSWDDPTTRQAVEKYQKSAYFSLSQWVPPRPVSLQA